MANKFRREVAFVLDGHEYNVRPTLTKISNIEANFGPALAVARKLGNGEMGLRDITALVTLILEGVPGAPPRKQVPDLVFNDGAYSFAGPIVDFIVAAINTDEPATEDASGN